MVTIVTIVTMHYVFPNYREDENEDETLLNQTTKILRIMTDSEEPDIQ